MKTDYIFSDQLSLYGQNEIIGFGNKDFYIKEINRETANKIIKQNHYSGTVYNGTYINLGLFSDGIKGVLQFGYAMNPASQSSVVSGTKQDEYLELNRMWLNDLMPKNSESKAISYSIKYIKRKYPKIAWIQSFADERCGRYGVVYQACNFLYCGEHTSIFWELNGTVYHNSLMTRNPELTPKAKIIQENKENAVKHELRQFRYLLFIKKQFRKNLLLDVLPYPKHKPETLERINYARSQEE